MLSPPQTLMSRGLVRCQLRQGTIMARLGRPTMTHVCTLCGAHLMVKEPCESWIDGACAESSTELPASESTRRWACWRSTSAWLCMSQRAQSQHLCAAHCEPSCLCEKLASMMSRAGTDAATGQRAGMERTKCWPAVQQIQHQVAACLCCLRCISCLSCSSARWPLAPRPVLLEWHL